MSATERWRRPLRRLADRIRTTALPIAAAVVLLLLAAWAALDQRWLDPAAIGHLLYVPVILAAVRFGTAVGGGVGAVAALLAACWGRAAPPAEGVAQGAMLVVVGAVVGAVSAAYERRRAREHEVEQRERSLSNQRVALVQLVSHELRTPLTVIRGSMETLRSRPEAVAPRFKGLVDATQRSASRLEEMVGMMLAAADDLDDVLARRSDVAVAPLVHHAAISIRKDVADRVRLDVPPNACVETVEAYLWLTLRCLLDNAVRFSPEDEPIDVEYVRERDRAVFTMRDHGAGLPDGFEEESAFEPFTQGDASLRREHNGLGMGLYTARRLARRLGGDIELHSEESEGVTARIMLPQPTMGVGGRSVNRSQERART